MEQAAELKKLNEALNGTSFSFFRKYCSKLGVTPVSQVVNYMVNCSTMIDKGANFSSTNRILKQLCDVGPQTVKDLMLFGDYSQPTVSRIINNLHSNGFVTSETVKEPGKHPYTVYTITEDGRTLLNATL
jgi:predicted transcriptional regulator